MRHFLLLPLLVALALPPLALPAAAQPAEPAAVTQLRQLLGPEVQLSFASATATDVTGSAALTDVSLRRGAELIRIAEARLEGLRDDGIARLALRGVAISGGAFPLTLNRLDLEGFTLRLPPGGGPPAPESVLADVLRLEGWRSGGEVPVNIGAISIEGFGGGRPSQANVTALEIRSAAMGVADRVTIARITLAGLDAADVISALMEQRQPRRGAGRSSLEIEGVEVSQGGQSLARLSALTLRGDAPPGRPHTGAVVMRGLEMLPEPPLAEWMQRFGYDRLRAEARINAAHDVAAQRFDLQEFGIELSGIAEAHLALRLDGVPEDMTPAQGQEVRLVAARLRYADQTLYARWLRSQAQSERVSEAVLRQRLAQQVAAAMPGPGLSAARAAAQRFVMGQARALELTAQPSAPLRIGLMAEKPQTTLEGWQRMLGLSLESR